MASGLNFRLGKRRFRAWLRLVSVFKVMLRLGFRLGSAKG